MLKKFMCLAAVLVFVSACGDSDTNTTGTGNPNGSNGTGSPIGGVGHGNAPPGSVADFVQNVGDRVLFDFNSSELSTDARTTLDHQATWLKHYTSMSIAIEGHCDERGTREYNLALGERRATAAKNYLIANGVDASRVKTISYGKERPAVLGHNEEAWAQNRRAVSVPNG